MVPPMNAASALTLPLTSLVLGSSVHIASLRLKLDNHAWWIVGLWNLGLFLLFLALAPNSGLVSAVRLVSSFSICFLSGFYGSMAIYRLFLSPARHFPGPRMAALTSFYRVYASIKSNIRLFTVIEDLHKQYGDYVRVGPREISILNPAAIPLLYGPKTQCRRGPWYDHISGKEEDKHVLLVTDPATHSWRRRVLDKGLSSKALADYENRIQSTVDDLVAALENRAGTPIDMTEWVSFFSFDAMGRIAYNHDFGMLKRGEDTVEVEGRSTSLKALHTAMRALGVLGPVPWLFRMIGQTGAGGEISAFFHWCHDAMHMKQRTFNPAAGDTPTDIASWILKGQHDAATTPDPAKRQTQRSLENTSSLLILAGSDTSSSAISNALFYLARSPTTCRRLRAELDNAAVAAAAASSSSPPSSSSSARMSSRTLASIPYLNHVINETLRLKPPACDGLGRETPPAGLTLPDGTFIPPGVVVAVPPWALHRDERLWGPDAASFRPERWAGVKDLTAEALPFIPFSRGAGACPGKQLAYVEMRKVIAAVVGRFEIEFAEGRGWEGFDEGGVDSFTLTNPPLVMVLRKRG